MTWKDDHDRMLEDMEPMCWYGDFTPEGYNPDEPFVLMPVSEVWPGWEEKDER